MMKASIIIAVFALIFRSSAFAQENSISADIIFDSVDEVMIINGSVPNGPERTVDIFIKNESDETVFYFNTLSADNGEFNGVIGTGNMPDGEYDVLINSGEYETYVIPFSVPYLAESVKIQGKTLSNEFFMLNGYDVNTDRTLKIQVSNARLKQGEYTKEDVVVQGLPGGIDYSVTGLSDNILEIKLFGTAGSEITESKELTLQIKSSVIAQGNANTSSDIIEDISLYDHVSARTIQLRNPQNETVSMKNYSQINDNSSFIKYVDVHDLAVDGKLEKGVHFDYTVPQELSGLTVSAAADKESSSVKFTVSGKTTQNVTASYQITNCYLMAATVAGCDFDSEKFAITVTQANQQSGNITEGAGGGSSSGGGASSGGASSGGFASANLGDIAVVPTVPVIPVEFTDIEGHWGEDYIVKLSEMGIVKGDGEKFYPDNFITRAEFVTMVTRAIDLEVSRYKGGFSDVAANDWHAMYVQTALDNGLIAEDTLFRPNDNIVREEMTKIIVSAAEDKGVTSSWNTNIDKFSDYEAISDWAADYVRKAYNLGLVKGDENGYFNPRANATRAEAAAMIYRLISMI